MGLSFVLDAPKCFKNISGGGLLSAPREFHPSEVLSKLPPLVATDYGCWLNRFTLDFMAGQEYHYPHCWLSPYQKQSDIYSRKFLAHPKMPRSWRDR
jgi:hypothetical protein